jgi:hypothetical protein
MAPDVRGEVAKDGGPISDEAAGLAPWVRDQP